MNLVLATSKFVWWRKQIRDGILFCLSDLGRMYQLVSRIQDGLGELKTLLETHIYNQGLAAVEKCGDSALNVSIIVFWL